VDNRKKTSYDNYNFLKVKDEGDYLSLKNKAYAIILVHNYPNGKLKPSEYDINVTRALEIPAKVLGLLIYNHLIISSNGYLSFKKEGLL